MIPQQGNFGNESKRVLVGLTRRLQYVFVCSHALDWHSAAPTAAAAKPVELLGNPEELQVFPKGWGTTPSPMGGWAAGWLGRLGWLDHLI